MLFLWERFTLPVGAMKANESLRDLMIACIATRNAIANCLITYKTINRVKTAYLFNGTPLKYILVGLRRNIHVAYALINRHPLLPLIYCARLLQFAMALRVAIHAIIKSRSEFISLHRSYSPFKDTRPRRASCEAAPVAARSLAIYQWMMHRVFA